MDMDGVMVGENNAKFGNNKRFRNLEVDDKKDKEAERWEGKDMKNLHSNYQTYLWYEQFHHC